MCLDSGALQAWEKQVGDLYAQNEGLKRQLRKAKTELADLKKSITSGKTVYISKPKRKGYNKLKKLSLDEVLPVIGNNDFLKVTSEVSVRTSSIRLRTFKKSLVCAGCGIVGTHFWVECNDHIGSYHLNLYAVGPDGDEILMTKDHIIPKSRGGSENSNNMQTMCTHCNCKKGNHLPSVL